MKIQLGQEDITAALRAHIASQGINLEGKTVEISFTQTRPGKTGPMSIAANVSIENAPAVPDLSEGTAVNEPTRPALAVVASNPVASVKAETPAAEASTAAEVAAAPTAIVTTTGTDDAVATAAVKTGTSLFN
jgi:head-tail adaptor